MFYEQKCPGTACRTNPSQIFPDSSQGFVQGFLFDSYEYGLRPDTASVTLHSDSDGGFSWRGGDWLLMRWLGDQMPAGFYRKLDQNVTTGVANIESASGQSFPTLFANFGLALVTDSLPGLPRNTAPPANRFVTRNVRQLWARLFATSAGPQIPLAFPIQMALISSDTSGHQHGSGHQCVLPLEHSDGNTDGVRPIRDAGGCCSIGRPEAAIGHISIAGRTVKTDPATGLALEPRGARSARESRRVCMRKPMTCNYMGGFGVPTSGRIWP